MILKNDVSLQSKIGSYLRYGLQIAKKTEVNKKLTNHDHYKQKMIEKYLDRAREIKDSGLYRMIQNPNGKGRTIQFETFQKRSLFLQNASRKKSDFFIDKQSSMRQCNKNTDLSHVEPLHIQRQRILNEMVRSRGDANKLYSLNIRFSHIENEMRIRHTNTH